MVDLHAHAGLICILPAFSMIKMQNLIKLVYLFVYHFMKRTNYSVTNYLIITHI